LTPQIEPVWDNKRLLHDIFHIGPGISPRLLYQAVGLDMGRGLIPGPIWKMPCNDLFITYFQAEEIRIYVKHNFNMNIRLNARVREFFGAKFNFTRNSRDLPYRQYLK
jgi:hypothetical protein